MVPAVAATTGFQIQIKFAMNILAAFVHPGKPVYVPSLNIPCLYDVLILCAF